MFSPLTCFINSFTSVSLTLSIPYLLYWASADFMRDTDVLYSSSPAVDHNLSENIFNFFASSESGNSFSSKSKIYLSSGCSRKIALPASFVLGHKENASFTIISSELLHSPFIMACSNFFLHKKFALLLFFKFMKTFFSSPAKI